MEKKMLNKLPIINFLLSLFIVFHHGFTSSVGFNGSYKIGDYGLTIAIERYLYNLSECAVPFFYYLSAYLFYRTFDGTWEQYRYKIKRRFWSLLVPYVIFNSMGYFKALVFHPDEFTGGGIEYLRSIWESNTLPLWFIRELMALSILAPIIFQIKKRPFVALVVSIIIFLLHFSLLGIGVSFIGCLFIYWEL